ncbi:hypothetical protein B0T17DRAFT_653174 [Bombardia bombarda]|uniref:BZIP domain-containing protein n=1 Tax=Bombardia bombarda TaxID=252184 RepID=A0AA40C8X5_9PEZI|nr:hypothetical protein B0T17DRAFT_653174 [Bombardia bombarda]
MSSAEDQNDEITPSVAERRQRGRLAQRAFRQRQIDTIRALRAENQALKDAISDISQAVPTHLAQARGDTGDGNTSSFQTAILNALDMAGLAPPWDRNQDSANDDNDGDNDDNSEDDSNQQNNAVERYSPPANTIDPTANLDDYSITYAPYPYTNTDIQASLTAGLEQQQLLQHSFQHSFQHSSESAINATTSASTSASSGSTTSGRISPRLTYGLWIEPDRALRMVSPPRDIVPYLGDGIHTLAGALYWAGLRYGRSALQAVMSSHNNASSSSGNHHHHQLLPQIENNGRITTTTTTTTTTTASSHNDTASTVPPPLPPLQPQHKETPDLTVQRLFGNTTLRLTTPQTIHDVIDARFVWLRHGFIADDHPGRDPDASLRMFAGLVREFGAAALRAWMTPVDVEAFVRARLVAMIPGGSDGDGWMPWAEALMGRGDGEKVVGIRRLVGVMAENGVCFGDGPRWRADLVRRWVEWWIGDIEASIGFGGGGGGAGMMG